MRFSTTYEYTIVTMVTIALAMVNHDRRVNHEYSRATIARIPMVRLPWLIRSRF